MKDMKIRNLVKDVIQNKKFEIEMELDFNIHFSNGEGKNVIEEIKDMRNDPYFYQEHSEFLDDFEKNGDLRYVSQYMIFCDKLCPKNEKGENISGEFMKTATSNATKKKFRKHLIRKTNKKLKMLEKCFTDFCENDEFYKICKKITEMEKLKNDVESDIVELKKKITPKVFPDLKEKVNKYKVITAKNELFFYNLFTEVIKKLDAINIRIMRLRTQNKKDLEDVNYKITRLYITYFGIFGDYKEKIVALSECEDTLNSIKKELKRIEKKVEERENETR